MIHLLDAALLYLLPQNVLMQYIAIIAMSFAEIIARHFAFFQYRPTLVPVTV